MQLLCSCKIFLMFLKSEALILLNKKVSCANTQEAYRPRHSQSMLCCSGGGGYLPGGGGPTLGGGGGGTYFGRGGTYPGGGVPTLGGEGGTYPRRGGYLP